MTHEAKSPTIPRTDWCGSTASGHAGDKQLDGWGGSYRSGVTFSGQGRVKDILAWDKAQSMVNLYLNTTKTKNKCNSHQMITVLWFDSPVAVQSGVTM